MRGAEGKRGREEKKTKWKKGEKEKGENRVKDSARQTRKQSKEKEKSRQRGNRGRDTACGHKLPESMKHAGAGISLINVVQIHLADN